MTGLVLEKAKAGTVCQFLPLFIFRPQQQSVRLFLALNHVGQTGDRSLEIGRKASDHIFIQAVDYLLAVTAIDNQATHTEQPKVVAYRWLGQIKNFAENRGMTFAMCRETCVKDTGLCDPFHLLPRYNRKRKFKSIDSY